MLRPHTPSPDHTPLHVQTAARKALAYPHPAGRVGHAPATVRAVFDSNGVVAIDTASAPHTKTALPSRTSVFRIASMTKSFLAATALSLSDEGAMDLHRPVYEYVPDLPWLAHGTPALITLADLLSNAGGLVEDNPWGDDHLGADMPSIARDLGESPLLGAFPGTTYHYSNLGQSLVGRAVEHVTGHAVESVIHDRIIAPLGLSATGFVPNPGATVVAGWRTFDAGHTWLPAPDIGLGALSCIGGLYSTIDDIATWASFLASAWTSQPQRSEVLSPRARLAMQRLHTVNPGTEQHAHGRHLDAVGYGYGLVVEHDHRFGVIAQHSGGLPGFSSHMRWHADSGLGVVVFAASDSYAAGTDATAILATLLTELNVPAARVRPWAATIAAAKRIDHVVVTGQPFGDLHDQVARNVLTDQPGPVRDQELAGLLHQVGGIQPGFEPFEDRVLGAPDPSRLRWRLPGRTGDLVCDVRMMGLSTPVVEAIDIAIASEDGLRRAGTPSTVLDHHAAVM